MDPAPHNKTNDQRDHLVLRPALIVDASLLEEIHELIDRTQAVLPAALELSQRTLTIRRQLHSLARDRDDDEVEVLHEQTGYWGLLAAWSPLAAATQRAIDDRVVNTKPLPADHAPTIERCS